MPGATLEEIEGDVFRGVVKVKLGAISTAFKGQASFVERDDDAHRAVLKGEGRDTTGKGNASALITARLEPVTDGSTKCNVETDLHITGKVAQFGRGIMSSPTPSAPYAMRSRPPSWSGRRSTSTSRSTCCWAICRGRRRTVCRAKANRRVSSPT